MTGEASGYRRAVAPLALGTFAVGTEGLAVAGILPEISAGLHVSLAAAGQLVTVFAVAYALSAPLLAVYGSRRSASWRAGSRCSRPATCWPR